MSSCLIDDIDECISIVEKAIAVQSNVNKKQLKQRKNQNESSPPSVARYIKIHLVDPQTFLIEFATPKRIGSQRPIYYDISINNHIFNKVVTQNKAYPNNYKPKDNKPYIHKILVENCKHGRKYKIIINTYNDSSKDKPTKSDIYKIQTCINPSIIKQLNMNKGIISWQPPTYKSFGNLIYELIEAEHEEKTILTTNQCSINIDEEYKKQQDENDNVEYKLQDKHWRIRIKEQRYNYYTLSPVIDYNIGDIKTKRFTAAKHVIDIGKLTNFKTVQFPEIKKPPKPEILKDINKIKLIDKGTYLLVPTELDNTKDDVLTVLNFSDTHTKHKAFKMDALPPADIIIHAGDFTFDGRESEVKKFEEWGKFIASLHIEEDKNKNIYKNYYGKKNDKDRNIDNNEEKEELLDIKDRKYKHLICIAGNHETTFDVEWYNKDGSNGQRKHQYFKPKPNAKNIKNIIMSSPYWIYLEDTGIELYGLNIYGSPWQPFYNDWAFNLKRDNNDLYNKWKLIPNNTDILITHGPPYCHGDKVAATESYEYSGCKHLIDRVKEIDNISFHIFGHVHSGVGGTTQNDIKNTIFINASSVNHSYAPEHKPIVFYIKKKKQ